MRLLIGVNAAQLVRVNMRIKDQHYVQLATKYASYPHFAVRQNFRLNKSENTAGIMCGIQPVLKRYPFAIGEEQCETNG
jgi:hypothetical protein